MSRHLFVYPVLRMTQAAFVQAHVAAFGFFGGVPARLVCDNLTAGVLRPDLYDPRINRAYRELAGRPEAQLTLLLLNLDSVAKELAEGSVVVFESSRVRIRRLPPGG